MGIKIKRDDLGQMICPTCKDGRLYFNHESVGGEVESWACTDCPSQFHVDIEIKRNFDNVREATQHGF